MGCPWHGFSETPDFPTPVVAGLCELPALLDCRPTGAGTLPGSRSQHGAAPRPRQDLLPDFLAPPQHRGVGPSGKKCRIISQGEHRGLPRQPPSPRPPLSGSLRNPRRLISEEIKRFAFLMGCERLS